MISIKENVNSIEEFNYLYDAVGWGSYDEKVSEKALANTMYSVSVYDDDKIIGYGRIIGDGICFLYIHDVMVAPKYQSQKIGTKIMNNLLDKINEIRKENPLYEENLTQWIFCSEAVFEYPPYFTEGSYGEKKMQHQIYNSFLFY